VAFGLDRIMVWLEEHKAFEDLTLNAEVLLAHFPDTLANIMAVQKELHKAGVHAEIYLEDAKLQKQFKYADKKKIPWVILVGSDEVKNGAIMMKNMRTGEQETLTTAQAISLIRKR
jgi:histidyl-tRNA synthetase